MVTNFPESLDSLTNPTSTDSQATVSHAGQHANANDAIEALQAKVGVDSSTVATSLDKRVTDLEASGSGDVTGPASAIDEDIAIYNGTTGKIIKDGGYTVGGVLSRANHTGTQTASTISDFDTEVGNNTDVAANTSARHDAVTVTDTAEIDLTLTGQDIQASLKSGSIDETKLDTSVNASLDLADSAQQPPTEGAFVDGDKTKLDGIEALADVTDTANVTAAGALMDSEVDADIKTLALPANTTISTFGASLVDDASSAAARTTLDVDQAGTDNSTDVTLAGTPNYITIAGQVITRNQIDLTTDVTGNLPTSNVADLSGTNTGDEVAATTSVSGISELATSAEVTTGTDTGRTITPDGFAGSDYGKRVVGIQVIDVATDTATGDDKAFFRVPSVMNGWNLVGVAANVATAGTTGTTDVQIHNVTSAADMLSTKITIDSAETDSSTATTPPVIDVANDDVSTGDRIRIDIDAVSTTAAKGLYVEMVFQLP